MKFVKCVKDVAGLIKKGDVMECRKSQLSDCYSVLLKGIDAWMDVSQSYFKVVKNPELSYTFKVTSEDAIDPERIKEVLTMKAPVLCLTMPSGSFQVYLHDYIWRKAKGSGLTGDDGLTDYERALERCFLDLENKEVRKSKLSELVALVKEVVQAPWKNPCMKAVEVGEDGAVISWKKQSGLVKAQLIEIQ